MLQETKFAKSKSHSQQKYIKILDILVVWSWAVSSGHHLSFGGAFYIAAADQSIPHNCPAPLVAVYN